MRYWIRFAIAGLLLVGPAGCGGGDEDTTPEPVADTTGDEAPIEDEPIVDEPEPEPTGPGQLHVVNRVGGADAGGTVQVLDSSGEVAAEGSSGATFNLDAGEYRVIGQITDDSILVDTPTRELDRGATVRPGETTEAENTFPVARILIRVTRGGRSIARWTLRLTRDVDNAPDPITLEPTREHIPITPGRYTGMLRTGTREVEVSGLIFQGGATMTVPVNVD